MAKEAAGVVGGHVASVSCAARLPPVGIAIAIVSARLRISYRNPRGRLHVYESHFFIAITDLVQLGA